MSSFEPRRSMAAATLLSLVLGSTGLADGPVGEGTWHQWRGPSRDGQVTGPTWPASLAPEHLTRVWHVPDLGPSYAGPLVTTDRVFTVGTVDKSDEVVRAFDRSSGQELWQTRWKGSMSVPFFANKNGSWIRSTPAFDGENLYIAGMRDVLMCLESSTGSTVWKVDFTERYGTPLPAFGFVCSPLVTDQHVYVQAAGGLVKLDKLTGEAVWRSLADGGGMNSAFSSPILVTVRDRAQIVVQTREELCGVDPEDGNVLWRQPIKSFRGMNILTPVTVGDSVFTAPYGGRAQLLNLESADGAFTVSRAWDQNLQGYMTSPVVIDGHAYFFTRSNRFACVRLSDGERRWVSGPTGDDYWSIVAQGDMILALSNDGRLRLIKADPEAYEMVSEAEVAEDQTWAHVAVAGRDIVIREQEGLALYTWK
ncbi:MAG: PQQ-binding-like beta-propeller repeat protein [Planctomycetota bacterium]